MRSLLPALLFLLPGVLGAQAATYTYINQKSPYKNPGTPMLQHLSLPKIGSTFRVQVPRSFSQNSVYFLATGVRPANIDMDKLICGGNGCWNGFLYVLPDIVSGPTPKGTGYHTFSFAIPNNSALLGQRFYQQALWRSPFVFWQYTLSRGGVGVIGR